MKPSNTFTKLEKYLQWIRSYDKNRLFFLENWESGMYYDAEEAELVHRCEAGDIITTQEIPSKDPKETE